MVTMVIRMAASPPE